MVDELCEKLKEVESGSSGNDSESPTYEITNIDSSCKKESQDPVKRYYAAFPALTRNTGGSQNLITLIPKWFNSPNKTSISKKKERSASYEEKYTENMKAKSSGKQKFLPRNKKDFGYCRNVAKSADKAADGHDWSGFSFNSNNPKNRRPSAGWRHAKNLLTEIESNELNSLVEDKVRIKDAWKNTDDTSTMYNDLPVDIQELLDSPSPRNNSVELMNFANTHFTGSKKFLQCGTNILSSIWSSDDTNTVYDNSFNTAKDSVENTEMLLNLKFSSISIDPNNKWPASDIIAQNEQNAFYERFSNTFFGEHSLIYNNNSWNVTPAEKFQKWSEGENCDKEASTDDMSRSLLLLNHSNKSLFTEVIPRPGKLPLETQNSSVKFNGTAWCDVDMEEDLLYSLRSHFKPISESENQHKSGQYPDGTTFVIPKTIEKITYKRGDDGYLYVEGDSTMKKYLEYQNSKGGYFKFVIVQNDKGCQTEDMLMTYVDVDVAENEKDIYFPGDQEMLSDDFDDTCDISDRADTPIDEEAWANSGAREGQVPEAFGKYSIDMFNLKTVNSIWEPASKLQAATDSYRSLDKQSIRDIWGGNDVAVCRQTAQHPTTILQTSLREDIHRDGEQLLSDLSTAQRSYMEELPIAEVTCDLSKIIGVKERKRRHSSINMEGEVSMSEESFSFASRLEEDCLMKIAAIPTLRSVTL